MEKMIIPSETHNIMYQDFTARRPMEVETYLGSPIKLAQENGLQVPRIETLYALLHNINIVNQTRPQGAAAPPSPPSQPTPRMSSAPMPNGPPMPFPNGRGPPPPGMRPGMRPGSRAPSQAGGPPPPPGMRRGPPSMSGYPPPGRMNGNGWGPRGPPPQQMSRRPSFEGNDLEEFSHLMLYDNVDADGHYDGMPSAPSGDLAMRERELALRQKELALREREYHMRRGGPRMPPPPPSNAYDDDDEDGEDFFDPTMMPAGPGVDPDNIDMMSVTSRRTRKAPSASQLRNNPEMMGPPGPRQSRGPMMRRPKMQNRTSAALMSEMPNLRQELMSNPLMGYSSDRFGTVDRMNMGNESRANSLTAERLNELQHGGPPNGFPPPHNGYPMNRRGSASPGNPLSPGPRPPPRTSPPNGYGPPGRNGRPSPPGMRQPVPRHPPGHGNAVAPHQIEQQTGVSNLYPPKSGPPNQVRSLTGSASASTGSGDSHRIDSEQSAHTSSSSLGPRPPIGVR